MSGCARNLYYGLTLLRSYVQSIGSIIAKAQITNGGPVVLLQPENEYSQATPGTLFPNHAYFQAVEDQYRAAGIVVPFVSNDAAPHGYFAPGTGNGSVDIYGHDAYPLGFDCANPYDWPNGSLPTDYHTLHLEQSPSTPYTLSEFQGGSFDPWGGSTYANCTILLNEEFERVFYKNDMSFGVTIFSIYMVSLENLEPYKIVGLTHHRHMEALTGVTWATLKDTPVTTMELPSQKTEQ